jgi:DNA-binding transcriptional LysR family regulator
VHLSQVDLNLFVVLDAIYRERNITRAGYQLNLTQPAISHALKRLRDLLKDPLFVRRGAEMVPTPFTRSMIDMVRQALQILEVNLCESHQFDPAHTRRNFHISLWEYIESIALPTLLRRLERDAPEMSITTTRVKRRNLEAELARGSLDLAIDVPMTAREPIHQKRLLTERLVVMAREGHPAIHGTLDLETYLAQPHALVSSRRHGPSLVDLELSRLGFRRKIVLRCQHTFPACRVAALTDLLLTLSESHARLARVGANVCLYPLPLKTSEVEAHMYWHESVENDPANRWLRQQIEAALTPTSQNRSKAGKSLSRQPAAPSFVHQTSDSVRRSMPTRVVNFR